MELGTTELEAAAGAECTVAYHEALKSAPYETWLALTTPLVPSPHRGPQMPGTEMRDCPRCGHSPLRVIDTALFEAYLAGFAAKAVAR